MNKIMLVGNVVKDCELHEVGKDKTPKGTFTLACNERISKDNQITNFVPCVIWGKMAESLTEYIKKGSKIAVAGRLDIRSVESEEYENEWKTYVSVNVNELDFCSLNKADGEKEEKPKKQEKKKR